MKTKLFLLGLLSFFYVNSQVIRLVELPSLTSTLETFYSGSGSTRIALAPTNDECDGAIELTVNADYGCENVTPATIFEATDSGMEGEAGTADDDVWFSFVATNTIHRITLQNVDDDKDMVTEILQGSCGSLDLIEYVDDPNVLTVGGLEVGVTYYVRVYSYTDTPQETTFDICVGTPPGSPANDECENAINLTVSPNYICETVTTATLQSATDSGLPTEEGNANDDVWFSFTAVAETHRVKLDNIEASDWGGYDLVIEVMEGDCGGTIIESNNSQSVVIAGLVPEMVYYVRVYSYTSTPVDTTFDICIGTTPDAPANDECSDAVVLVPSSSATCATPVTGTLQSATNSGLVSPVGTADDDVWYSFVATSTNHLISLDNVEGDITDLVFQVLEGQCDGQTSLLASDPDVALVNNLEIGATYYIRVFSYGSDNDADTVFDICIGTITAPANDECDAAVALTVNEGMNCAATTSGTLAYATDSGTATTTGTADDDVWYSFTATSETHKVSAFNVEGSTSDLVMEVFEGQCGGLLVKSSDPETFTLTELSVGTVYYLRVYSYGDGLEDTTFDLCVIALPAALANDECEDATALTVNTNGICENVTTATLANATDSGVESEEGNANDDVWFSFVATAESHRVNIAESDDFETLVVEVFDGVCGGLAVVSNPDSSYVDGLTIGTTYYVRVFSDSEEPVFTVFDICVSERLAAPANDDCDGAIALTVDAAYCNGVLTNGNNLGSTPSEDELADCFEEAENDVWFSFTVPANVASVDISTDFTGGTLEDTVIALYSGACGDLTEIDCNDDGGEDTLSRLTDIEVSVGTTYYVRVTGYSSEDEGTFCLEISTNETLSTGDFTKNTLKAYPNPVKDILNLNNPTAITEVAIFNLLGQQVVAKTVNANEGQIDMSHLAAGAYLVKVTADNAVQTIKIIKE